MCILFSGKMPRKVYRLERRQPLLKELILPDALSIYNALQLVLRLPSVASKRYLTNKVDRCVTGLVAQQQCVGPLHTPLADVAVTAISYFGYVSITLYWIKLVSALNFRAIIKIDFNVKSTASCKSRWSSSKYDNTDYSI